jgi:hypothetical protein
MSQRYTIKDAEKCFIRLVSVVKGRQAKSFKDVGGLRLDYNPMYGGVNVEQIANEGGGVSQPFGSMRMKPEVFCHAVRLAEDAIAYRRKK